MNSSWYKYAEKKKADGYSLYMKENFKNEREGKPVELFKPIGEITPPIISAAPGAPGEILCTYFIHPKESGKHIHFYVKKKK